ncbi:MAG: site-specific integrase [Pseudonocardiaceae bacterium]
MDPTSTPTRVGPTLREAVDAFVSSPRCANPNTRRAYAAVLDRALDHLGPDRPLTRLSGDEVAGMFDTAWAATAAATWNRNRAAVSSWLAWCAKNQWTAPALPSSLERRPERVDQTKALPWEAIERQLGRRDVPLREKTLWRMLYETAARASEIGDRSDPGEIIRPSVRRSMPRPRPGRQCG